MKKRTFYIVFFLFLFLRINPSLVAESLENTQESMQHQESANLTFRDVVSGFAYRPLDMGKNVIISCLGKITGWAVANIFIEKPVENLRWLALYEYFSHIPASYLFSNSLEEALNRSVYCFKDYVLLNVLFLNGLIDVNDGEFDLREFFHMDKQDPEAAVRLGGLAFIVQRKLAGILNIGVRRGLGNRVLISLSSQDQRKVYMVTLALLFARELANFGYYLIPEDA